MGTVNPRTRGPVGVASELKAATADRQQIRRLVSSIKIPPSTTGGVVGMAEVVATAGTVLMPSGGGNLDYASVTYGAPYDPNVGGGASDPSVSSWLSVSGYQLTPTAGWYEPVLYVRLIWDSQVNAPAAFGPYIQGGNNAVHNDYSVVPGTVYSGGRWGLVHIANHGPTYMDGTMAFHAEVRPFGTVAGNSNPAQSALLWNITKLA